ncbi:MAG: class I SAM-dependent methyltransferase [Clostridium sp.]|nr:class I SAM-dependent methyltransferase [Clostridium sp.]
MEKYYDLFKRIKEGSPELINEYPLYYKEAADLYDQIIMENSDVKYFINEALLFDGPVLELCCGSGRLTLELLKMGMKVTAVDLSIDMLENLKAKFKNRRYKKFEKNIEIVNADMTKLELDKKFKFIMIGATSIRLLEEDFSEFFDKMYDLLDDGGCFIFDFEDLPVEKEKGEESQPMSVIDLVGKENKLILVFMLRVINHIKERAFVNFMRVTVGTEEKVLLSHTNYRMFGVEDIKNDVKRSKFKSYEIISIANSNSYICKMVKK